MDPLVLLVDRFKTAQKVVVILNGGFNPIDRHFILPGDLLETQGALIGIVNDRKHQITHLTHSVSLVYE